MLKEIDTQNVVAQLFLLQVRVHGTSVTGVSVALSLSALDSMEAGAASLIAGAAATMQRASCTAPACVAAAAAPLDVVDACVALFPSGASLVDGGGDSVAGSVKRKRGEEVEVGIVWHVHTRVIATSVACVHTCGSS